MYKNIKPINKLLLFLVLFITVLITTRVVYTESNMHIYLLWNIFLATIPYAISRKFYKLRTAHFTTKVLAYGTWLLFFPNAMYLVTDLVHVSDTTLVPLWYDVILLFSASFLGLVLSYLSLKLLQQEVVESKYRIHANKLIGVVIMVSSFGVYLGRFLRWNSWDIISNPFGLLSNVMSHFTNPIANYKAWVFTALFSVVSAFIFYSLDILRQQEKIFSPAEK